MPSQWQPDDQPQQHFEAAEHRPRHHHTHKSLPPSPALSPWAQGMQRRPSALTQVPSFSLDAASDHVMPLASRRTSDASVSSIASTSNGRGAGGGGGGSGGGLGHERLQVAATPADRKQDSLSQRQQGGSASGPQNTSIAALGVGLDLAKMRNPTLVIHMTSHWTIEVTYAELLQWASIALSGRRIMAAYWPSLHHSPSFAQRLPHSHSGDKHIQADAAAMPASAMSAQAAASSPAPTRSRPYVLYVNAGILLLAVVSLEARSRAEHLGLRRTALMLCGALFVTACASALL